MSSGLSARLPQGRLEALPLAQSTVYPGATHTCQVYIPAQYTSTSPAPPCMIFTDGALFATTMNAPAVLDELIARGDIPPLVGIFVDPGVVPVDSDETQRSVWNRPFEYDAITGRFASFLVDELLPAVEKTYKLSKDPSDRGITGVSTGAVAAFRAAWERPDQFRRVATFIGTFVDIMGANVLPFWVRKTDPKPLRVFQEDTTHDMELHYGDWAEANRVMAAALDFARYDHTLLIGEGVHDLAHPTLTLPEALRWLWRDYPTPITAPSSGPIFESLEPQLVNNGRPLLFPNEAWEQVGGVYESVATPAANREGAVFFADPVAGRIYHATRDGSVDVFRHGTADATALQFGPDGRLYAIQPAARRIVSFGPDGDERTVADDLDAHDLAVSAGGAIYVTDTANRTVCSVNPNGVKRTVYDMGELAAPTALALSADQAFLYVLDAASKFGWSFKIAPDGTLVYGQPRYRLEWSDQDTWGRVEGMTVDSLGTLYIPTLLGIALNDMGGRNQEIINTPEWGTVRSVAFGGARRDWLYVGQNGKLFRRRIRRTGVVPWQPVKPPIIGY